MTKIWLVAQNHFLQEVTKRSFLLILFSMPLFLTLTIGLGYIFSAIEEDEIVLGYVDQANMIILTDMEPGNDEVTLVALDDNDAARDALEAGEIDAFYRLPTNYRETHEVELVYYELPDQKAMRQFENLVRLNLLADQPPNIVQRALSGAEVSVQANQFKREYPAGGPAAGQFLPLLAAAIFAFLAMTTSGYMVQAVVVEKENRTIEIVISSLSPRGMMAGKIIGTCGIALLQLTVWIIFLLLAIWIGANVLGVPWLKSIVILWPELLTVTVLALPSFIFITSLMTAVGASVADGQEADQVGPLIFLILMLPVYLLVAIAGNPNGPLAIVLSFIPLTSFVTMAIRSLFFQIPFWQVAVSLLITSLCALMAVWLAGSVFRLSLLRYGQRLNSRELFHLVRIKAIPPTASDYPQGQS